MWTLTVIMSLSQVLRVVGCLLLQLFLLVPQLHRWALLYDINQTSETQLFSLGNTSLVCIRLPSNIATASYLCLLCHFLMLKCLRDVTVLWSVFPSHLNSHFNVSDLQLPPRLRQEYPEGRAAAELCRLQQIQRGGECSCFSGITLLK